MSVVAVAAAAVKMICKDREDSFVDASFADADSIIWDGTQDGTISIDASVDGGSFMQGPSRDCRNGIARQRRAIPSRGKNRSHLKAESYGDENNPMRANVDREQAMKIATKPLTDMSSIRFSNGPSIHHPPRVSQKDLDSASFAWDIKPGAQSPRHGDGSVCSRRVLKPATPGKAPSFGPMSPAASPGRTRSFSRNAPGSPAASPGRTQSFSPSRPQSFSLGARVSDIPTISISGHSSSGHGTPRPGGSRAHLQAVVVPPKHHGTLPVADDPPFVVYQPRMESRSGSSSYIPPQTDLQPREMSRRPACRASGRTSPMGKVRPSTGLFSGNSLKLGPSLRNGIIMRSPSHDEGVCQESNQDPSNRPWKGSYTIQDIQATTASELLLSHHVAAGYPFLLGDRLIQAQERISRRSRSASVFWRPPPEARPVCEQVKCPSFLMHTKAECPAATSPGRSSNDDSLGLSPPKEACTTLSSQAMAAVVCGTLENSLLAPSPRRRRGFNTPAVPSPAKFSYLQQPRQLKSVFPSPPHMD